MDWGVMHLLIPGNVDSKASIVSVQSTIFRAVYHFFV